MKQTKERDTPEKPTPPPGRLIREGGRSHLMEFLDRREERRRKGKTQEFTDYNSHTIEGNTMNKAVTPKPTNVGRKKKATSKEQTPAPETQAEVDGFVGHPNPSQDAKKERKPSEVIDAFYDQKQAVTKIEDEVKELGKALALNRAKLATMVIEAQNVIADLGIPARRRKPGEATDEG